MKTIVQHPEMAQPVLSNDRLIEQTFNRGAHFIWLVMIKMPFLPLNNTNDINCGHVRKCVMRSIIFWTIYL